MRYVTFEGRHKVVLAQHFSLLNHFRNPDSEKVNFPYFILHSLEISMNKFKKEEIDIIKLVYDIVLAKQSRSNPKVQIQEEEDIPLVQVLNKKKMEKKEGGVIKEQTQNDKQEEKNEAKGKGKANVQEKVPTTDEAN